MDETRTPAGNASSPNDGNSEATPQTAARLAWEKPVLLQLSVDQSDGVDVNFVDEDDFGTPS